MPGPDSQDRNANTPYAVSRSYRTINGTPALVTIWSDGSSSAEPVDISNIGANGGGNGGVSASTAYSQQQQNARDAADLAERQRQFNETMGYNKARGDQSMQLDQATQKWKEAVDARDYQSAEFWKARAQELQQNNLALNYTQLLANKSGPQDWVKYWKLSRGISPVPGEDQVPLDQALPAWARGVTPGSYPNSSGRAPGAFSFTGPAGGAGGSGGGAQPPMWMTGAPGWQQPGGIASGTASDVLSHTPTSYAPNTFAGAGGTPIDFSGSTYMQDQAKKMPNWMAQ